MTLHSAFLYHCWLYCLTRSLKRGEKHEISLKIKSKMTKIKLLRHFQSSDEQKYVQLVPHVKHNFLMKKRGGKKDIITEKYKTHKHLKIKVTCSLTAWKKAAQNSLLHRFRWCLRIAPAMKYNPKSHKNKFLCISQYYYFLHEILLICSEANKDKTAEHPL